jgi:sucrose-6-phosphate hydrolase SacC (GH32 family)
MLSLAVVAGAGSATVMPDGKIFQLYPGICKPTGGPHGAYSNCTSGGNLNLAVPADPSDPLLTNWTKLGINPIVNNTQRDPSSAWRTPHGEWRIVTFNTTLYASTDFLSWYEVGQQPGFDVGECPSFLPLPRETPGSGPAPPTVAGRPTHVYKNSHAWSDFMQPGSYTDGAPGVVGKWKPWETAFGNTSKCIDEGEMYATKDMPAPGGRRLYWGWTAYTPPAQGVMSLPRELTWHPELQQLVHSVVPELSALRELPALANVTQSLALSAGVPHSLDVSKRKKDGAGLQAEVDVTFALPLEHNATLGVMVMEDASRKPGTTGMLFWVNYVPPPAHTQGQEKGQGQPYTLQAGSTNLSISSQCVALSRTTDLTHIDFTHIDLTYT